MAKKKKIVIEKVKKNTTALPDELFYSKNTKQGKKERARKQFFDGLKDEDYNPNAKKDFDNVLSEMLKLKGDSLE